MPDVIPAELLEVIACPEDKADLKIKKDSSALVCTRCKREYPIKNGIPVLLPQA
jgi:uncharacterized protein YbaR (Trm112 family)